MKSNTPIKRNNYDLTFGAFQWRNWVVAGSGTIILNCVLFLFLPIFMHSSTDPKGLLEVIDQVDVIRLKKKEPPARKKKPKPPEQPREKPQKDKAKLQTPKPVVKKTLTLPFKLNTKLPALSADFQVPFSDSIGYGAQLDGVVDMAQLDKPLTPLSRIPPVYPIRARRKGIEGWARVRFEVDEYGTVSQLQVLEGKPPGVFNKSVYQCVSKWRFKPGTVEGVPVRARMETTIRFEME